MTPRLRVRRARRAATLGVGLAVAAALSGCRAPGAPEAAPGVLPGGRERISATVAAHLERTFDELLETLEQNYVYGRHRGVDWAALRDAHRGRIGTVADVTGFAVVVREMLTQIGDPDVVWQSREERIEAELSYSTRYEGIGTYISFRESPLPRVLILEVIPGSPAERAGLRAHDAIVAIDGTPVRYDESLTVAQRIRGPRGTAVRLDVLRPGLGSTALEVTRDRVDLSGVERRARYGLVGSTGVAYLLVPRSAPVDLADQVGGVLEELGRSRSLSGLILDLRISSTGSFPLEEMLALFADGDLGTTYTAQGEEVLRLEPPVDAVPRTLRLSLIVGPDTEGLAEIFVAALQAAGRAVVVGRKTPGVVEQDQQFGLVDGSRLWLPVWSYRAPDGAEVGLEGVTPDVVSEAEWDQVTETADGVRTAAAMALGVRP